MTERGERGAAVGRREFLRFGLAAAAGAAVVGPLDALAASRAGARKLSFYNTHTGEKLTAEYWVKGSYVRENLRQIDRILRDHRTGDVREIDPGLLDLIHAVHERIGTRAPFHVISGYRSPKTNALLRRTKGGVAQNSYHMKGMAIDVRLPGVDTRQLFRAGVRLRGGGVGYYPESDFVHLDVGPIRSW